MSLTRVARSLALGSSMTTFCPPLSLAHERRHTHHRTSPSASEHDSPPKHGGQSSSRRSRHSSRQSSSRRSRHSSRRSSSSRSRRSSRRSSSSRSRRSSRRSSSRRSSSRRSSSRRSSSRRSSSRRSSSRQSSSRRSSSSRLSSCRRSSSRRSSCRRSSCRRSSSRSTKSGASSSRASVSLSSVADRPCFAHTLVQPLIDLERYTLPSSSSTSSRLSHHADRIERYQPSVPVSVHSWTRSSSGRSSNDNNNLTDLASTDLALKCREWMPKPFMLDLAVPHVCCEHHDDKSISAFTLDRPGQSHHRAETVASVASEFKWNSVTSDRDGTRMNELAKFTPHSKAQILPTASKTIKSLTPPLPEPAFVIYTILQKIEEGSHSTVYLVSKHNGLDYSSSCSASSSNSSSLRILKVLQSIDVNRQSGIFEALIATHLRALPYCVVPSKGFCFEFQKKIHYALEFDRLGGKSLINFLHDFKSTSSKTVSASCSGDGDGGPLSLRAISQITGQLLFAVMHLHMKGLIHCDLKLENLLLFQDFESKASDCDGSVPCSASPSSLSKLAIGVIDFESLQPWNGSPCSSSGQIGSAPYRAPELLLGQPFGPEIDFWAIGCIIFELLEKKKLFDVEDDEHTHPSLILTILASDLDSKKAPDSLPSSALKIYQGLRRLATSNSSSSRSSSSSSSSFPVVSLKQAMLSKYKDTPLGSTLVGIMFELLSLNPAERPALSRLLLRLLPFAVLDAQIVSFFATKGVDSVV